MFCNSTITDLFLFVFTQLILHYPKIRFSFLIEMLRKKSLNKKRRLTSKTINSCLLSLRNPFFIEWALDYSIATQ